MVATNAKSVYLLSEKCLGESVRPELEVSKVLSTMTPRRSSLNVVEHGKLRGCFIFDNTIGGALPILSTLRSLLRTGWLLVLFLVTGFFYF